MLDLAVIGLGLIGSAALRHAAATAEVVGIGPGEPELWAEHDGPFASHYDSGRITRGIDAKREWATLARRSIAEYPVIEQATNTIFHRPSGVVFVRNDQAGIDKVTGVAEALGLEVQVGPVATTLADVPELTFPPDWTAIREAGPAGAIDPRLMVNAQLDAAEANGALVARDTVVSLRPAPSGSPGQAGYEVLTESGRTHQARNVIVAAGSYSNHFLSEPLAVGVRPEAVVIGEISDAEAERLSTMPSVLYLLDHDELDDVYVVPPVRYPDGKQYIKIGGSGRSAPLLTSAAEMNAWMRSDEANDQLAAMRGVLESILADVTFLSWATKPCLITDTASGLPYIDRLDSGVTVAFGGNGHAAKSADAIGALAAGLALSGGEWTDTELDATAFNAQFGRYDPPTGSRHGT
jgi:sarcosine oxidase